MDPVPSPDSSPSNGLLDAPDLPSQPSRKRQRSLSMQSDSAASNSSVKRSVADNFANESIIRSPRLDQSSSSSSTNPNHEIDAYMAEQGEESLPAFIDPNPAQTSDVSDPLTPQEKHALVERSRTRKMEVGETWHLVARAWYKRWLKACTGAVDKEGPVEEGDIGPVDNSLIDEFGNLRSSLLEGVHVEYVPEEVWVLFTKWYGAPIHPLPRRVIARGASRAATLELRPLVLNVFKVVKSDPDSTTPFPTVVISAGETVSTLCSKLAQAVSPPDATIGPYRIWAAQSRIESVVCMECLSEAVAQSDSKVLDESAKTLEEVAIESDDSFFVEFKQSDGWIVPLGAASTTSTLETPAPIFNSNDGFFNRMASTSTAIVPSSRSTFQPPSYDRFSASKTPSTAVTFSSKSFVSKTVEPGTLGLGNMGNTCFMNSALQCLSHTKELAEYFLSGVFENELNRDNPLGMGGAIAEAFGALLQRIWSPSGSATSYSPREFKMQLQRFAPQFSGYQQHDSQELVAFLLDGLHEDLNRVLKKPYVEKPDWEGGGDLELAKLAKTSWDGYMLRNDSVIVDLFQGQYQSTLVCPECQKVSITFDPFMYLTLPLPIQKKWKHSIFYVPWDLSKPHVKVTLEINRDSTFKDLRALLGRWMGAPAENLLTLEIFNHRFYKNLDDITPVGDVAETDTIVCFELPCNARQNRTYKRQPNDPFVIPVFLSESKPSFRTTSFSTNRANSTSLFGYPMVVVIEQEQARDLDDIYGVVLTRLSRWTTHARDLFSWVPVSASELGDVPIPIERPAYPLEAVTEIREDGNIVPIEPPPPEGDIVDEKSMILDENPFDQGDNTVAQKIGPKPGVFTLRLQPNQKDFGATYNFYTSSTRGESWESRKEECTDGSTLLRDDDGLYAEFDENMKNYYFGDIPRYEHANWDQWGTFTHPEYEESKKAAIEKKNKGITLQDCLDEFTKEEELGDDDLWYCPSCKKHQKAKKKFTLWKAPDILAVHLKRFSNNRSLRDKIDAHVDFPIEGLDLTEMVGEREVARRLVSAGVDVEDLNLTDTTEPLLYDLFAVDEHIGGLGGGHYRAYSHNHADDKWYHFDDSYVTPARASDSVNANAYLLFYRRRSSGPLGGATSIRVQQAKEQQLESTTGTQDAMDDLVNAPTQLPTPPDEPVDHRVPENPARYPFISKLSLGQEGLGSSDPGHWDWRGLPGSNAGSSVPSPPNDDPPDFEDIDADAIIPYTDADDSRCVTQYKYQKASPTSSVEAERELDEKELEWRDTVNMDTDSLGGSPDWARNDPESGQISPISSYALEVEPFDVDASQQSKDGVDEFSPGKTTL